MLDAQDFYGLISLTGRLLSNKYPWYVFWIGLKHFAEKYTFHSVALEHIVMIFLDNIF
jgi:hypothetical protein